MKTLITIFTLFTLTFINNDPEIFNITAKFDGFEDDTYYFTDSNDKTVYIQEVSEEVSKKFNLKDTSFNGKTFKVTFETQKRTDEKKEIYEIFVITKLELIQ